MKARFTVGLVGNFNANSLAHRAIPAALQLAGSQLNVEIEVQWIKSEDIVDDSDLLSVDGIWCVPGSPYLSLDGALKAVKYARETKIPFLGTCGGFQHAVLEYARNVLGWQEAGHAEIPDSGSLSIIAPLDCALIDVADEITLFPETKIINAYKSPTAFETYRCSYALNNVYRRELEDAGLNFTSEDSSGAPRSIELPEHPFFVATLFQPERRALTGEAPPLVIAFLYACVVADSLSVL